MAKDEGQRDARQTGAWMLFVAALMLAALRGALQFVGQRLLFSGPMTVPGSSLFVFSDLVLLSLLPLLINPVLLFYVFYRLGRRVRLAERYKSVIASAFTGGLLGSALVYFLLPVALGSTLGAKFPDLLSVVSTVLGLALAYAGAGFATLFPGFAAVALANLRGRDGVSNPGKEALPVAPAIGSEDGEVVSQFREPAS